MRIVNVFVVSIHPSKPPAAYAPVIPEDTNQASPYLVSQIGPYFYYHIQLDETFEMPIEQAGLNDIIARGDISAFASFGDADIEPIEWPVDIGGPVVDVPAVQFIPDAINVMAETWWAWVMPMLWQVALVAAVVGGIDLALRKAQAGSSV